MRTVLSRDDARWCALFMIGVYAAASVLLGVCVAQEWTRGWLVVCASFHGAAGVGVIDSLRDWFDS